MDMMGRRLVSFLIFLSVPLTGCATIKSFNMPKVESRLTEAYQNSDDISAKIKEDLTQKKMLIDSLTKGKSATFKEIESNLKLKMSAMDSAYAETERARKMMAEAKAEVASLAYSRAKIRGDEAEYPRVEDAVSRFELGTEKFNKSAADYSRESNSLADLVASKKLYFNFDVGDFLKRSLTALTTAQENTKVMAQELTRTENIVNSYANEDGGLEAESVKPLVELAEQMKGLQSEQVQRVTEMETLRNKLINLAGGQNKIPSTAANWGEFQKLVTDFDRTTSLVNETYRSFQGRVGQVRSLRKPSP